MIRRKIAAQGSSSLPCFQHSLCQMLGPWFWAGLESSLEGEQNGAVPGGPVAWSILPTSLCRGEMRLGCGQQLGEGLGGQWVSLYPAHLLFCLVLVLKHLSYGLTWNSCHVPAGT